MIMKKATKLDNKLIDLKVFEKPSLVVEKKTESRKGEEKKVP